MGVGSIVHKKVRLIFSTILIVFSLICFGVMLSAYNTDVTSETLKLFEENGATEVRISKYKNTINQIELIKEQLNDNSNYVELEDKYSPVEIDETFEKEVEEKTGLEWQPKYTIDTVYGEANMVYPTSLQNEENYPLYYYIGNYGLSINFLESDNMELSNLIGNKPNSDDEIVITSYIADMIIYRGCMAKDNNDEKTEEAKYQPKDYNELISSEKYINICNIAYLKVVGIVDNSEILSKYDIMKDIKASDYWSGNSNSEDIKKIETQYYEFYDEVFYNQSKFYVNSSFITKMKNVKNTYSTKTTKIVYEDVEGYSNVIAYINESLDVYNLEGLKTMTILNDNEIVISETTLDMITNGDFSFKYEGNKEQYDSEEEFLIQYLKDNEIINKTIKANVNNGKIVTDETEYVSYKIVGVILDESEENASSTIYYSQKIIEPLITSNVHCQALIRTVNSIDEMKTILKYYPVDKSDELSYCKYSETAVELMYISYFLSFVAKYGVVFFLVFSAIILMSFINSSIKFRKKEIGTLRALGCRSRDIITMFLYESIVLMVIALIIAFAIIPKITDVINRFIIKELLVNISLLSFGITQILEITGIMFIIVILANVIPVRKITKMKPIDAILNK